jgi:hypothetical protein
MTSLLAKFFGRPPAAPVVKPGPKPGPKSAARLADEKNILDARRAILANMAQIEKHPTAKQKVIDLIDKDADRASQVVRNILLGEGQK